MRSLRNCAAIVGLLLVACGGPKPIPEGEAKALVQQLGQSLMGELQAAIAAEGPAAAIGVCSERAIALSDEAGSAGYTVRRIGTRVRNHQHNMPTEAERSILEGLTADAPSYSGTIDGQAVFMQAIFIPNALCLTCHGEPEAIPQAVRDELANRYPKDEAVGYGLGDLRGAFVVERRVE